MKTSLARNASVSVMLLVAAILAQESFAADPVPTDSSEDVTTLSDIEVVDDPLRALGNTPSATSFGFSKPLLETPRSVSLISEEQISLLGISSVEDLTRAVPGTFTTTRYGLQGGIQVRGVPADQYYRGMKRLQLQGHARTVLSAMDNIEVVKGPPSPLYGMGRIGGYANLDPKSSRARTGAYLPEMTGFAQFVKGSYNKTETTIGVGGPTKLFGKDAGFYIVGLQEDSDTWVRQVEVHQKFGQGTASIENAVGPFRAEFGGQVQNSVTSGAYMNRMTQDLIDNGIYIKGQPLVQLDSNHDGAISFAETHEGSPVLGNLSGGNHPLYQSFAWPKDADGNLLPVDQFPKVAGIPQTLYDYLVANPEADPTGLLRAQGPGGPVPISGQLPIGFALDPRTVGYTQVDFRRNGSFEREQNADQWLGYFDLIYDKDPNFMVKNQLFTDNMDTFKDSYLPYGEKQDMHTIEDKLTVTKRIPDSMLPGWLKVNSLGSVNYRRTNSQIRSSGGDFDNRQDIMYQDGHLYPNTSFWTQLNRPDLNPATRNFESTYWETGVGLMFDVDIFEKTNLLIGGRYDYAKAESEDRYRFTENTGTSANPGGYLPYAYAEGTDNGTSYSISLSHQLPYGLRPYLTYAKSSLTLASSNDGIARNVAVAGMIGEAKLKEIGLKASLFGNKLQLTASGYDQTRNDVTTPDDPTAGADVSSTQYRGVELEAKWVPNRNTFLSAYALRQTGEYIVNGSCSSCQLSARDLGFQDVVDPATGEVIYPAEAFLYGGRAVTFLPAGNTLYQKRTGIPETQAGMTATYRMDNGVGFMLNATWTSSVYADRLFRTKLPAAGVLNAGITYDKDRYHLKVNGYNVTDERYFRAAISDFASGQLVSVMPGRHWDATLKVDF